MSRVLASASRRGKFAKGEPRPACALGLNQAGKKRSNQASTIRSKPLWVTQPPASDYHHVIEISGWSRAIGIQFP